MASYAIIKENKREDGQTLYDVVLRSDTGEEETQRYVGDEKTLEEAARHFESEVMKGKEEKAKKAVEAEAGPVALDFIEVSESPIKVK